MLTFKTQFPINAEKDIDDLIEAGRKWLAGSPHSKLSARMRTATDIKDDWQHKEEYESVIFARHDDGERVCGLRYENLDQDSRRWITEIVGEKHEAEFLVSIQLSVDSELPVDKIDFGKRPYILKNIMQEIGGGFDGELPVLDTPIYLKDDQLNIAIDAITANAKCTMPVVYISVDSQNNTHIDAQQLAQWLSGMAHVMVEPTRKFSFDLMPEVFGENAYGGAVAIYWPDGIGKWLFIPKGEYIDPSKMQVAIAKKIRLSLLSQRTRRSLTWTNIQELKSKKRIQELKDSGSREVDDYVAAFEHELESKAEEIQRLEQEIARLKYGSYNSAPDRAIHGNVINLDGNEKDLYQGERSSIIVEALETASAASEDHSRRKIILDDIINSSKQEGQRETLLQELKDLLRSYTQMTPNTRSQFERLGFEVSEEGKHYKLVFRGDSRYPFILPKTGSDHRGGLNAYSDLKKRLF